MSFHLAVSVELEICNISSLLYVFVFSDSGLMMQSDLYTAISTIISMYPHYTKWVIFPGTRLVYLINIKTSIHKGTCLTWFLLRLSPISPTYFVLCMLPFNLLVFSAGDKMRRRYSGVCQILGIYGNAYLSVHLSACKSHLPMYLFIQYCIVN